MQEAVTKTGKQPTEALTIAKPLALMLLDSPMAGWVVKLAETSANGSALVFALVAYATRVTMDTLLPQVLAEMAEQGLPTGFEAMLQMAGLKPVMNGSAGA